MRICLDYVGQEDAVSYKDHPTQNRSDKEIGQNSFRCTKRGQLFGSVVNSGQQNSAKKLCSNHESQKQLRSPLNKTKLQPKFDSTSPGEVSCFLKELVQRMQPRKKPA